MAQPPGDTRVENLWFPNETLVLRAGTKIFQVPKALLAARSSVFRDMIGFPQPPGTETELHEGVPVVDLPDAASDVNAFLMAIFDSSYFMPAPEPIELNAVLGILRLSHKYDVPYLYMRALKRLSIRYGAQSVDQYLTPERHYMTLGMGSHTRGIAKVIEVLTEVGALWLLPMAYYMCSTRPAFLLRGVEGYETTMQKCLVGQDALRRGTAAANRFLVARSSSFCTNPDNCNRFRLVALDQHFTNVQDGADLHPLDNWDDIWEAIPFCGYCATVARARHAEVLQAFWDNLPNLFELPPWPELHAMREAVMNASASG
ncbi:hypothetical protein DFH06DRAFT_100306 [Mycena polygramma]|nr:hypothetical protein DFH06DRAFT_100306 [Mycena polygramma]